MRRILLTYILLFIVGQLATQAQVDPNNPYGTRKDEFGNIVDRNGNPIDPAMLPQNPDYSNGNERKKRFICGESVRIWEM